MLNILWVKLKDYRQSLPMIVGMTALALGLIYIFGRGFSGAGMPTLAVTNLDGSPVSQRFVTALFETEGFRYEAVGLEAGREGVADGQYMGQAVLEEGFGKGLLSGEAKITFYRVGASMEHRTIENNLQGLARIFVLDEGFLRVGPEILQGFGLSVVAEDFAAELREEAKRYPIVTVTATAYAGEEVGGYDSLKHSFIGYILFFSMFTMVFGIGSIVEEKENHVWQRLSVSPMGAGTILFANMLAAYIVSMVQLTAMILISRFLFGIDWGGSLLALFLVLSCYVIAIIALGLVMSGFVSSAQQLGSFSPIVIVSTSMIGGCMWPLEIISSQILLFMADLTPQRWAYKGLKTIIVGGGGVGDVTESLLILLVMAAVLFAISLRPYLKRAKTAQP